MVESEEFYTVGQMSKLCNISIKTLRYYDEIGLLLPEQVDSQSNYRYYTKKQMLYLNIIKHFRTAGFSLEEIRALLKRESLTLFEEKLNEKLQQTTKQLQKLEILRNSLEVDLNNIRRSKAFSEYLETKHETWDRQGIEVKEIPAVSILFTRYRCPSNPNSFIRRYSELSVLMEKYQLYRVGPLTAIFHDDYRNFDYNNADIEVCAAVAGNLSECPNIREYGRFLGVTMLHKGSYSKMPESYSKALRWMEHKGYEFTGSAAERYIIDASNTTLEENYVTELIMPVKKR